jgi:hypothetical protein
VTKPKIVVIFLVIAVVASVLAVTTGFQGVMASYIPGHATEVGDIYIAEATEAENATIAAANQTVNRETTGVEFLGIQNAQSGSISQINTTAYTLELSNVSNGTIMFSDRPERIVETVSTSDFVRNWTAGPNSFSADAPNAALVIKDKQASQLDTAIIELFDPKYDMTTNTLTYTVMTENGTTIHVPREFGATVMIIDTTFINATPGGYS